VHRSRNATAFCPRFPVGGKNDAPFTDADLLVDIGDKDGQDHD
jgi:hypothetical protein